MLPNQRRNPFKMVSSEIVWSCPWYEIRQDKIVLLDGSDGVFNVVDRNDSVFIVPVTPENQIVLIKNYRYPAKQWFWEVPAGGVKDGSTPMETAYIELEEEIGGHPENMEGVGTFYILPGLSNELSYVFLARGVMLGDHTREASELMEHHSKPIDEVFEMALRGDISSPSITAILMCAHRLGIELTFSQD